MAQFMLILNDRPTDYSDLSPEDMQAMIAAYNGWAERLGAQGKLQGGLKLADEGGRLMTKSDGRVSTVDGPFAEAKGSRGRVLHHPRERLRRSRQVERGLPAPGVRGEHPRPSGGPAPRGGRQRGMTSVEPLVDHLFRERSGQMVASLTRIFGPAHIDLAEDVVQDALVTALRVWSVKGIPAEPAAWLHRVARNRALDALRRDTSFRDKREEIQRWADSLTSADDAGRGPDELRDDQLRMIFTCCHPVNPPEARVALTLKTLGGFGVGEIARAFLSAPATIAQRLVRAKRRIREGNVAFVVPESGEFAERLDSVLGVIYLMFNEGYGAHQGERLIRDDLVREAIRLATLLTDHAETDEPRTSALLALMLLQGARLGARTDAAGHLMLLDEQDRGLWDRRMIAAGFRELARSARGEALSSYHVQAAIAACHAQAASDATTDWAQILLHYDRLSEIAPSPIVSLNRAVAVLKVDGPAAALSVLEPLEIDARLSRYYLLPAIRGECLRRLERHAEASEAFAAALALDCTDPERAFLQRKADACRR